MLGKKCIFCKKDSSTNKITKEHVFPKWLKKELKETRGLVYTSQYIENRKPIDNSKFKKGLHPYDQVVNDVCMVCNNGWMSALESKIKDLLAKLIHGHDIILNEEQCNNFALWSIKTALILSHLEKGRSTVPPQHYTTIMNGNIPDNVSVFIGYYRHDTDFTSRFLRGNINFDSKSSDDSQTFYLSTFTIGHLYVHISYFSEIEIFKNLHSFDLDKHFKGSILRITPELHGGHLEYPTKNPINYTKEDMSALSIYMLTEEVSQPYGTYSV
ncbi:MULTISPECIES: hypothetical protein [Klebsiella pneumoniae complex]|uniref:hypothetical protein n=1 Tax=Klebsiella pneumoniae complex TaxID=3390273 RepID=UPI0010DA2A7E|nr:MULTISPECIES: hypothetical protein [Klebsiella]MCJ3088458.1 hypothetical protein [Klebsiella quasipneumoniae]MDM3509234.1 hypothetical protein [Klebsiella pneumoniae]VTM27145.1 Uncharacterised protein [Klebsiella pneumoniae]HBQ3262870.1 hypothetical protein [Klebsiella pneumoniae]HBS6181823.1 hypothetical protein [Klebsiella pneumoniae]